MADHPSKPTEVPSDEADRSQIRMARQEGAAYQRSLDYMIEQVADNSARQRAGDYVIALAQERAEGMYRLESEGNLVWQEAQGNCHLEVSVSDAADQRFVPGLQVSVMLVGPNGMTTGPLEVPFLWHPGLYHYGRDLSVADDGAYTVTVEIAPANFMRHDRVNGRRYGERVTTVFTDFNISTGRE